MFSNKINKIEDLGQGKTFDINLIVNSDKTQEKSERYLSMPRSQIHLNPFYLYLNANIPRFQAGEFFKFSSKYHKSLTGRSSEDNTVTIQALFNFISEKAHRDVFMLGSYKKVINVVSEISDKKGEKVLGKGFNLEWLALCPNPYDENRTNNEHELYDFYRNFPFSRWIDVPQGQNKVNVETLEWMRKNKNTVSKNQTFYFGNDRMQPDYSRERFLEDYIAILITFLATNKSGSSMFELLWPVNDYAAGLIGLIGILYGEVNFRKQVNTAPDNPLIVVYGQRRKIIDEASLNIILNVVNFEKVVSVTSTFYQNEFSSYFSETEKVVDERISQLRTKKFH